MPNDSIRVCSLLLNPARKRVYFDNFTLGRTAWGAQPGAQSLGRTAWGARPREAQSLKRTSAYNRKAESTKPKALDRPERTAQSAKPEADRLDRTTQTAQPNSHTPNHKKAALNKIESGFDKILFHFSFLSD